MEGSSNGGDSQTPVRVVPRNIVVGQHVDPVKADRARQLRKAMTPAERLLWGRLRANRLSGYHFRRQQVVDGFIVDFYCHQAALSVEVDGDVHDDQTAYDEERDQVLSHRGIFVLRIR